MKIAIWLLVALIAILIGIFYAGLFVSNGQCEQAYGANWRVSVLEKILVCKNTDGLLKVFPQGGE